MRNSSPGTSLGSALDRIGSVRVLPVLRTRDAAGAVAAVAQLVAAGIDVAELTTTTAGWPQALEQLRSQSPEVCVGVGTILDVDAARTAVDLGAQFLVSPRLDPDVSAFARVRGVPFVQGALTPTEVIAAVQQHGVAKLFPAATVGPDYLRALLAVVPGARIIATGGIALTGVRTWLDAGAYAVGVGRDLIDTPDIAALWSDPASRRVASFDASGPL